ncbi:MAG: site-specific DNA-methyltransferase [Desulfovibrio sp.]|jgi:site-specific DNA-methyltransferase (adenine-specific)/adenine-specific DNA-methyltransferase|nr:site-specific DNA-methyltransferase [Desulfovibrio sp.]
MQEKISSPLSPAERREICALVAAGRHLPLRYRDRLFQEEDHAAPVTLPAPSPREYFPARGNPACSRVNTLIRGDNLAVLQAMLDGPLDGVAPAAGGVRLIYLDPPFAVGAHFPVVLDVGGRKSALAATAYSDVWREGPQSFQRMISARLPLMRDLLADDGSIYVHCDWRAVSFFRLFLDYLFGPDHFLGEIIWHYTGGGRSRRYFSRKHDTLLHYAKSRRWIFHQDAVRVPYAATSGFARSGIVSAAGKKYSPNPLGTPVDDVWSLPIVNPMSRERLPYPTQKPEVLLERILRASSSPGDLVADFFCGSGTTLAVAERLGRAWLGADSSPFALQTTRKRLLALRRTLEHSPPLAILDCAPPRQDAPFAILLDRRTFTYDPPEIAAAVRRVPGGIVVELRGFLVRDREGEGSLLVRGGLLCRREGVRTAPLMRTWRDWVDSWSLDAAPASGCFVSLWQGLRRRGEEGIDLASPVLPAGSPVVSVRVVDIFAREHTRLFPLGEYATR